jgi:hypothetical protein
MTQLARLPLVFALTVMLPAIVGVQPAVQLTGVRIDNAFRLVGSNSSGLVVSVKTNDLQGHRTSDDFALVLFDADGRRSGTMACLAVRFLDGGDPKPPWALLDDPAGTLAGSYHALVDSKAAVIEKARKKTLETAGRYELVYLVTTTQKRAALAFSDDVVHHPGDLDRRLIGSFSVPWQ